jgi:hypothetical protein
VANKETTAPPMRNRISHSMNSHAFIVGRIMARSGAESVGERLYRNRDVASI